MATIAPEKLDAVLTDAEAAGLDKKKVLDQLISQGYEIPGYGVTTAPAPAPAAPKDFATLKQEELKLRTQEQARTPDFAGVPGAALSVVGRATLGASKAAGEALASVGEKIAETSGKLGLPPAVGATVGLGPTLAGEMLPKSAEEAAILAAGGIAEKGLAVYGPKTIEIASPFARKLAPTFAKGYDAAVKLGHADLLSAAEKTGSRMLSMLENGLLYLPFSADVVSSYRMARHEIMLGVRNTLLDKVGPAVQSDLAGQETKDAIETIVNATAKEKQAGVRKVFSDLLAKYGEGPMENYPLGEYAKNAQQADAEMMRKQGHELYQRVAEVIPDDINKVKDANLVATAKRWREQLERVPSAKDAEGQSIIAYLKRIEQGNTPELTPQIQKLLASGVNPKSLPPEMLDAIQRVKEGSTYRYQDMDFMRSDFNRKMTEENPYIRAGAPAGHATRYSKMHGELADAAQADLDKFAAAHEGEIKTRHNVARAFWKDYKNIHDSDEIRRLARARPDDVYGMFVGAGKVAETRALHVAVGENGMVPFRRRFVADLVGKEEVPDVAKIYDRMNKYDAAFLREMLNPAQRKELITAIEQGKLPKFMMTETEDRLVKLLKKDPQQVTNAIISGNTALAQVVLNVQGPEAKIVYGRKILEKIIGDAASQRLNTELEVARALRRYPLSFRKLFFDDATMEGIENIKAVQKAIRLSTRATENPSGTAPTHNVIGMIQKTTRGVIGAAAGAAGAGSAAAMSPALFVGSVGTAVAPYLYARLYLSPYGRKLLSEGLSVQTSRVQQAVVATKIAAYLGIKLNKQ